MQRQQGQDKHLVGYLRLKPETVAKLLPFSGHNAVFVNKVKDRSGGPIFWIKRLEDETREAYFRRVSKMQKERKQSIVWRQGCGHDLGFGRTDKDENPTPSRIVTIRGLPEHWDDEDIVSFMHTQKWTNSVVTSRKKKCWYGKGVPPPDQKDHSWWAFTVDDEPPWTISIQVLPHRPRGPMMCQTTRGPARNNPSKDITMADSTMQLEPMVSSENRRGRSTTRDVRTDREASEKRSRSPKNKPDKGPDIVLSSQEPPGDAPPNNPEDAVTQGWKNEDFGGIGDCLFRAVGAHLEYAEGAKSVTTNEESNHTWSLAKERLRTLHSQTLGPFR